MQRAVGAPKGPHGDKMKPQTEIRQQQKVQINEYTGALQSWRNNSDEGKLTGRNQTTKL